MMVPVVPIALTKCVTTFGLVPDFRAGAFDVRARIVGIGELVSTTPRPSACISVARSRAYSMPPLSAGVRIGLGAISGHGRAALDGQVVGA